MLERGSAVWTFSTSMAMLFLSLLLLFVVPQLVNASCECGYSARVGDQNKIYLFADLLESDFTHLRDISHDTEWVRQQYNVSTEGGRGTFGKTFSPTNIQSEPVQGSNVDDDAGLQLRVGSALEDNAVPGSEADTSRMDLHWGSYRAGMKLTDIKGTCAAFFWYFNDTQEIDMEFLSREFDQEKDIYPVNLVVQSKAAMDSGHDASTTGTYSRVNLTFDPTTDYHEYRFDYVPGHVYFYADSQLMAQMEGSQMPSSPGHLILQHWSNGNPKWSGGPPDQDAFMTVSYVKAYFNSSDTNRQLELEQRCRRSTGDETVCAIPNVTPANASTGGSWFTEEEQRRGPHEGSSDVNGSGDNNENDSSTRRVFLEVVLVTVLLWTGLLVTI